MSNPSFYVFYLECTISDLVFEFLERENINFMDSVYSAIA